MAPSRFGWIAGSEVIGGGAEAVRVSHNAILVSRMHLATIALLCKQTTDNFRTRNPPEPRWRHLSGNRILFVPHCLEYLLCSFVAFLNDTCLYRFFTFPASFMIRNVCCQRSCWLLIELYNSFLV